MIELVPEFSTLCVTSRMFTVLQKKMLNVTSTADLKISLNFFVVERRKEKSLLQAALILSQMVRCVKKYW
jgi:hypothetical protein